MEYQVLSSEFDVLVVGAGPVGLWVACELALAKVNVAVLERRTDPVTQSRALAIQGRTLEVFALRGLADRFLSRPPGPEGPISVDLALRWSVRSKALSSTIRSTGRSRRSLLHSMRRR
jgi:2-polyprenyl-6-methoxyphenol hydroxylase-like FAD-dependent oxidoreductase